MFWNFQGLSKCYRKYFFGKFIQMFFCALFAWNYWCMTIKNHFYQISFVWLFSCLLHLVFEMFGWQNDEKMNEKLFKQPKCVYSRCAFEMRKLLSLNLPFVIISNKSNFLKDWMNDLPNVPNVRNTFCF